MKSWLSKVILLTLSIAISSAYSANGRDGKYFGKALCKKSGYQCITVKKGQNWKNLFPNAEQRDLVQRVNRTYNRLWRGQKIAVPDNLENLSIYDISPFPKKVTPTDEKIVLVDQDKLAWGAYDRSGKLIWWGPISSGKNYCPDIKRSCITQTGVFYFFDRRNKKCQSNQYPVGRGGAKMPYCMFFYKGFAMHGSHDIPGYRASHGCVRMFTRDAKWLNEDFVELPSEKNNFLGTKIVVQKLLRK